MPVRVFFAHPSTTFSDDSNRARSSPSGVRIAPPLDAPESTPRARIAFDWESRSSMMMTAWPDGTGCDRCRNVFDPDVQSKRSGTRLVDELKHLKVGEFVVKGGYEAVTEPVFLLHGQRELALGTIGSAISEFGRAHYQTRVRPEVSAGADLRGVEISRPDRCQALVINVGNAGRGNVRGRSPAASE
jgi:hypothetical protein